MYSSYCIQRDPSRTGELFILSLEGLQAKQHAYNRDAKKKDLYPAIITTQHCFIYRANRGEPFKNKQHRFVFLQIVLYLVTFYLKCYRSLKHIYSLLDSFQGHSVFLVMCLFLSGPACGTCSISEKTAVKVLCLILPPRSMNLSYERYGLIISYNSYNHIAVIFNILKCLIANQCSNLKFCDCKGIITAENVFLHHHPCHNILHYSSC